MMNDEPLNERQRKALAKAAESPEFPRRRIRRRIEESTAARDRSRAHLAGPTVRWAAAAAAALLIFVIGVEYGRQLGTASTVTNATADSASVVASGDDPVAVAIQAQGTRYVAELARLSETTDSLSAEELEQARGVAAAILYGAAVELLRAAPEDDLAELIVRALQSRRAGDDPLMWF